MLGIRVASNDGRGCAGTVVGHFAGRWKPTNMLDLESMLLIRVEPFLPSDQSLVTSSNALAVHLSPDLQEMLVNLARV